MLAAINGAGTWLVTRVGIREVQFYGGLALIGAAPGRWMIVGAILVGDVLVSPVLARLGAGRA